MFLRNRFFTLSIEMLAGEPWRQESIVPHFSSVETTDRALWTDKPWVVNSLVLVLASAVFTVAEIERI